MWDDTLSQNTPINVQLLLHFATVHRLKSLETHQIHIHFPSLRTLAWDLPLSEAIERAPKGAGQKSLRTGAN